MALDMYKTFQDGTTGGDTKDLIKREKKRCTFIEKLRI